jgi:hypothetical protein
MPRVAINLADGATGGATAKARIKKQNLLLNGGEFALDVRGAPLRLGHKPRESNSPQKNTKTAKKSEDRRTGIDSMRCSNLTRPREQT